MRLVGVDLFTASLPPARGFPPLPGSIPTREAVLVRLTTETGLAGWGEARGDPGDVSGETPAGMVATLRDRLGPLVLGRSLGERAALLERVDRTLCGNGAAKAALDIALHDLAARAVGVPLLGWLGGRRRPEVEGAACLGDRAVQAAGAEARAHVARGFRVLRVRVGLGPFERDVARIRVVREAVGDGVRLAVEANQAWTVKQAIARIRVLEPFGLECVEQPVAARDVLGMAEVARSVGVRLGADESLASLEDAMALIRLGAAAMFRITLARVGGLRAAFRIIALAEAARVPYVVGQAHGGLATVAAAHLALASAPQHAALGGADGTAADPTPSRVHQGGQVVVPEGPGLGVAPDEAKLHPVGRLSV
ncbi:MAG: mandelate racemase/muconate lactonizing enzyme family protein [Candidatus Rokuibacteriota bacterium]